VRHRKTMFSLRKKKHTRGSILSLSGRLADASDWRRRVDCDQRWHDLVSPTSTLLFEQEVDEGLIKPLQVWLLLVDIKHLLE
jgi:hypothetical protein